MTVVNDAPLFYSAGETGGGKPDRDKKITTVMADVGAPERWRNRKNMVSIRCTAGGAQSAQGWVTLLW
jgi:penicillin-binding protein 1A